MIEKDNNIFFTLVVVLLLSLCYQVDGQSLVINEYVSSNESSFLDEFEKSPDWIEIYNKGTNSIDLSNYSLSDDKNNLHRWSFPKYMLNQNSYIIVAASGKDLKNAAPSWETIIDKNEIFKYRLGQTEPSADWKDINYNDDLWKEGPSGIGYGDNDDATIIPFVSSLYIRKSFNVQNKNLISQIMFNIDYDDGYIAYLNGVEIARENLGIYGEFIPFNKFAETPIEAKLYQNQIIDAVILKDGNNLLHNGVNVLAIQVHNSGYSSSDLTAIPFLTFGYLEDFGNHYISPYVKSLIPNLHTNFSISNGNESIFLSTITGEVIDSVGELTLTSDVSFGRKPDGTNNWFFFDQPTPGQQNISKGYSGTISIPELIFESGNYSSPLSLQQTNRDSRFITTYTTDGSAPTPNSTIFNDPLVLNSTAVLKLKSFGNNYISSPTNTLSYFINEEIALPIVSISTNPDNLWDNNTGIYVMGPNAEANFPFFGANFWQDWERPAHIELFDKIFKRTVDQDANIKIFGAWSRGNEQKSLAIFPLKTIGYKIFSDRSINKFKSIVLRNSGNDWNSTMLRDGFLSILADPLNVDNLAYEPAVVYLNGEYWGIHNIREKLNLNYLASHHDVNKESIDLLENAGDIIDGTNIDYINLLNYMNTRDLSVPEYYNNVISKIDIDNFIDYQLFEIYIANKDWPGNNIKFWKERNESGKWRWILFDTDFSYSWTYGTDYTHNTLEFALEENGPFWPNPPWSTFLLRKLLENSSFKEKFINRYCDLANTQLKSENVKSILSKIANNIKTSIPRHSERWGQFSTAQWQENIKSMEKFADYRIALLHIYFMDKFNLASNKYLTLKLSQYASGKIKVNSIIPQGYPWRGNYFLGTNIKLTAIPNPGYVFTGWTGGSTSNAQTIEIMVSDWNEMTANFTLTNDYKQIVINEINYNSSSKHNTEDWLELYNNSGTALDLSNWIIKDKNDTNIFIIPQNKILQANQYLILCRDSTNFSTYNGHDDNIIGNFNFGLNNSGDLIRLFNKSEVLVDSIRYFDKNPWPIEPDGEGNTLELINPSLDNSIASSWTSSLGFGTPGYKNSNFLVGVEENLSKINKFYLSQNYPNPFNPITTIKYIIPSKTVMLNSFQHLRDSEIPKQVRDDNASVSIKVYDILGKEVATLVNEKQKHGNYKVEFDASKLSTGVYIYRIQSGDYNEAKKMILLK